MPWGWLRKLAKLLIGNLAVFVFLVALIEGGLYLHYRYLPKSDAWLGAAREYYRAFDADVIQYNQDCAKFDPVMTYTLRPNATCKFSNAEFSTTIDVNSLGARDDEESLKAPEVIVLGDSHTMGWGVEHEETFAYLLEQQLGVKVLNAGQSSYGTVRELLYLDRLDRSNLKALVIQYCENDNFENGKFLKGGMKMKNMSRVSYDLVRKEAMKRVQPYRFGNFIRHYWPLSRKAESLLQTREEKEESSNTAIHYKNINRRDADRFFKCLKHAAVDIRGIPIVLLEINRHNENDALFINAVEEILSDPESDPFYRALNIKTLDISPLLQLSDYYVLDDHMKPIGHEIIAEALASSLKEILGNKTRLP